MAELIEIRLADFRAFRQATLSFKPNGLMLVAGPNNAGKSALLSAFDVIAKSDVSISRRHAAGKYIRIWAKWQLNERERRTLLGESQKTNDLIRQGAASWLEWEFSELYQHIQPVAASVSWPGRDRLEFARMEVSVGRGWKVSSIGGPLAEWVAGYSQTDYNPGGLQDSIVFFPVGYPSNMFAVEMLAEWRKRYFHFQPLRESQGRSAALTEISPVLHSSGANLATVLLYLYTNRPDIWARLVSLVRQIVPGVGQLMIPVLGAACSIVFQDEQLPDYQHNIKDLGTGVEQLLMTLVVGLTQTASTIVLEEPETGLHSGAQRALRGLLQDWSKERLFVASTHSATMLDWTSPNASVYAVNRSGSESAVLPVTTERAAVLQELGVRLSDVLSAERILVLEGPTDKDIFEVWFPDVVRNPRVVIVQGHGGYNARHADLLAEWLDSTDALGQRRILYIRDRDELSAGFLERLESSPHVHILPCRELENLLLDFEAIAQVISTERVEAGKEKVSIEAIAVSAKELADELKTSVIMKRVMAELADPIRLVDTELRRKLSKVMPSETILAEEVLARVPEKAAVKSTISDAWQTQEQEVDGTWTANWRTAVPGADLLRALWKKYLDRGYDKSVDGLTISRRMKMPPELLVQALADFMSGTE